MLHRSLKIYESVLKVMIHSFPIFWHDR